MSTPGFSFIRICCLRICLSSLFLFLLMVNAMPVRSQFYNPFLSPRFPLPLPVPYPQASIQGTGYIVISREFPPGQITQENVSFYFRTNAAVSVRVDILSGSGQLFPLEIVPEDGEAPYMAQGNRIMVPVGGDKLDGAWHEWIIASLNESLGAFGMDFGCIARIEIKGEDFCMGPIMAFSLDGEDMEETTYLASFIDERDNIKDYGWMSTYPVSCEYTESSGAETGTITEGYVCLSPGEGSQQVNVPKIPMTLFSMPLGLGPFLPVTIFAPPRAALETLSSPSLPALALNRLAAQFYSPPINPGLAMGLLRSIPLYLDAQSGTPYSVGNNLLQYYDTLPTYPTRIDYANNPAYTYLGLNDTLNTQVIESSSIFIPRPYYF